MAAVPAWAPKGEEHLLGSTSVVQKIHYGEHEISYKTYLPGSTETITLQREPQKFWLMAWYCQNQLSPEATAGIGKILKMEVFCMLLIQMGEK